MARKTYVATALAVAAFAVAAAFSASSAQATDLEVNIDEFAFAPQHATVKAGTTVTWINEDDVPHTVASSSKLFNRKRSIQGTNSPSRSRRPVRTSISAHCIRT
jgi:plastocyanin